MRWFCRVMHHERSPSTKELKKWHGDSSLDLTSVSPATLRQGRRRLRKSHLRARHWLPRPCGNSGNPQQPPVSPRPGSRSAGLRDYAGGIRLSAQGRTRGPGRIGRDDVNGRCGNIIGTVQPDVLSPPAGAVPGRAGGAHAQRSADRGLLARQSRPTPSGTVRAARRHSRAVEDRVLFHTSSGRERKLKRVQTDSAAASAAADGRRATG